MIAYQKLLVTLKTVSIWWTFKWYCFLFWICFGFVRCSISFYQYSYELALNSIDRRWVYISAKTNISKNEFIIADFLDSTFFAFNNRTYKQVFSTPMGWPLSSIIADIVMQDLEEIALKKLSVQPLFYFRYVDDVILALPSDTINDALNIFNSLHTRLQFTLEVGRYKWQIKFSWYNACYR